MFLESRDERGAKSNVDIADGLAEILAINVFFKLSDSWRVIAVSSLSLSRFLYSCLFRDLSKI